ncbi:hypothetical protein CF319_g4691 [Tilletia indica]|nr:hypothetical protein CF319_g4691 [Tilletia indica]
MRNFNADLLSNGYRLTRLLGNGAFGTVWAAEKTGSEFAGKILRLPQSAAQERASHEAALHLQLAHPNIVKLHEFFPTSRFMVLIMEYISGGALEDHLPRAGELIEEEHIWSVAADIGAALKYLTESPPSNQTLVHRDIKPANILIRPGGGYVLADFGLSRMINEADLAATRCGTPVYMTPEMIRAGAHTYYHKVDCWALGATLFELCTGRPPFTRADGSFDVVALTSAEAPVPNIPKEYTTELRFFVRQLLSKDPNKRLSAEDILRKPNILLGEVLRENSGTVTGLGETSRDHLPLQGGSGAVANDERLLKVAFKKHCKDGLGFTRPGLVLGRPILAGFLRCWIASTSRHGLAINASRGHQAPTICRAMRQETQEIRKEPRCAQQFEVIKYISVFNLIQNKIT